jgi:hypothetical protein
MKKIVTILAAFLLILVLTKIANQTPREQPAGIVFSLKAQKVLQCTPAEITLADNHSTQTHLVKDGSWPECSTFNSGEVLDFYLARGEKTHFLRTEATAWWRKAM